MGQSQWDLGRFVKTLSYYGVVPILSSFDWFQSMFDSRPNPTLSPTAIAFSSTSNALPNTVVLLGNVPPSVGQPLLDAGYRLRSLVADAASQRLAWGDLADQVDWIETEWTDPKLLAKVLADGQGWVYGSTATTVEAVQADPAWQGLTQAIAHLSSSPEALTPVFDFSHPSPSVQDIWGALDDVVMGGVSQSGIRLVGTSAVFAGTVSTANSGGFASIRTRNFTPPLDFSGHAGVRLRLRGDGQRYKFMLRMADTWDSVAYCYSFDTRADDWMTVRIPFEELIPVFRAKTVPNAPALDPHHICAIQLMLSKFEYDGALNPHFQAGAFQLELRSLDLYQSTEAQSDRPLVILSAVPSPESLLAMLDAETVTPHGLTWDESDRLAAVLKENLQNG
ncbi:MAG: CIA30 family protein [Elainellaceae cyanobacterium]